MDGELVSIMVSGRMEKVPWFWISRAGFGITAIDEADWATALHTSNMVRIINADLDVLLHIAYYPCYDL